MKYDLGEIEALLIEKVPEWRIKLFYGEPLTEAEIKEAKEFLASIPFPADDSD